jgi:hypothetical protein
MIRAIVTAVDAAEYINTFPTWTGYFTYLTLKATVEWIHDAYEEVQTKWR